MKVNNIQLIANNCANIYTGLKQSAPVYFTAQKPDSFEKKTENKPVDKKTIMTRVAEGFAAILTVTGIGVALKKGKLKFFNNIKPYELKPVDTIWDSKFHGGKTIESANKYNFLEQFVNPIKKGEKPKNGFLVQGPDSKGKEEFFNWGIEQLREAGVEIIDAVDPELGHSTKKTLNKIFTILQPETAEQFKKDGKYKLFVLRKLEKIDPERNHEYVSLNLRGATAKSAENFGLILAYDCKDPTNFHDAVTRMERIDKYYTPLPKKEESLDIWKEFTKTVKDRYRPLWITKELEDAREIIAQKGEESLKEMEPFLSYHPPYEIPKAAHSAKDWGKYISATKRDLTEYQQFDEFSDAATVLIDAYLYKIIPKKKYNKVMDMLIENTPEQYKESMDRWINKELHQRM